jgi:hypothetical protein
MRAADGRQFGLDAVYPLHSDFLSRRERARMTVFSFRFAWASFFETRIAGFGETGLLCRVLIDSWAEFV